jgi:hypothetical protein
MAITTCHHCGERVFTITGWADLDHCPSCGRVLARQDPVVGKVRAQIKRESDRLTRAGRERSKPRSG